MGWIVSSAVNGMLGDDGGEKYSGGGGLFIDGIPSEGNDLFTGGRSSVSLSVLPKLSLGC